MNLGLGVSESALMTSSQSSHDQRNWKLDKWYENQLMNLECKFNLYIIMCRRKKYDSPVEAGDAHGVQPLVEELRGLGQDLRHGRGLQLAQLNQDAEKISI